MKSHNEIVSDIKTLNLSSIIYGGYVKLDRLQDLVYNTYGNSSIEYATNLNVFIDITSILHALYSEHNRIVYNNITDISAGIINMCAHYRGFFRQLKVNTKFFLINSLNCNSLNIKYCADYNLEFRNKCAVTQTKSMIDNNMSLLKVLCPYLPGIYYIDSVDNYETSVIIAYIIENLNDGNPNLIISHDLYPLQLPALYKYTSYLYPLKSRSLTEGFRDVSWMLPINEKISFREEFWKAVSLYRKFSYNTVADISPINYALFTALNKCPERSLRGICKPSVAARFINSLVGSEDIKINSTQFMTNADLVSSYPVAEIQSRYNAIDIQFALNYYRISPEAKQIKFLDLDDVATVNKIAAKYYSNNPLDLQKL